MVYDWIAQELGVHLQQPTIQPLTVLDIADWEQLCGLLERGWSAIDLLERKTGGYRRLDWRRMVFDDPHLPNDARASAVVEGADVAFRQMIERFGWDASQLDQA
jgi:hypothetical protein